MELNAIKHTYKQIKLKRYNSLLLPQRSSNRIDFNSHNVHFPTGLKQCYLKIFSEGLD